MGNGVHKLHNNLTITRGKYVGFELGKHIIVHPLQGRIQGKLNHFFFLGSKKLNHLKITLSCH